MSSATPDSVQQLADIKRALDHAAIVATTDVRGRITYVNDKFCQISGYSAGELLGQDHRVINSGHHPAAFIREMWQTIARGHVWHGEICNRAKAGHLYWVDTTIVPFLNEQGKPYQYIAIRADITARKAAEAQLAQQAALARVGQLAAVVAHEVRNPLAGVKGAIQILLSRRAHDDPEARIMSDIVARIDSLSDLINDLMLFARPRPPRFGIATIKTLVQDAIGLIKPEADGQPVDVTVEGPDDMTAVIDAEMIRAAILNLLLNAVQAAGGRGRVVVTIGARGTLVSVVVTDNGPGIPPDAMAQVFEPFFTTKVRGGGLGLPIAQRAAEMHGGTLTLSCPESGGTTATLTFQQDPRRAATQPSS